MQDPAWKKTMLSLERPYKNDLGQPVPVLYDITHEGEFIYEPKETPSETLGKNIRRILEERGQDFFELNSNGFLKTGILTSGKSLETQDDSELDGAQNDEDDVSRKPMTKEELHNMKIKIMPQLFIAMGEMTLARDLLSSILKSSSPSSSTASSTVIFPSELTQPESLPTLSSTIVTKPPPIVSVQAFNAQLALGGKDEALRKAASLFKTAANRMERGRLRSEKYWVDALKIRRGNWGLAPAPLPFGSATGKGADKTAKDFVISYGLEESPSTFRRRAIAHMGYGVSGDEDLVFPHRSKIHLRISVSSIDATGARIYSHNTFEASPDSHPSLEDELKDAQREVIEQEIFSILAQEAGNYPTASARVSERLILIDAAQGTELKLELVDNDLMSTSTPRSPLHQAKCDFIYHYLITLLLRRHEYSKARRLGSTPSRSNMLDSMRQPLPMLRPVIDLLQYQVFCERIKSELDLVASALAATGVSSVLRFNPVGEIGKELITIPVDSEMRTIGGEALLRIDNRHTLRLTMVSPSSLTVHLSQATLTISSIPQLCELLADEVERFFLERICEVGRQICNDIGGIWFVDLNRCIGRWEGCVLNFRITFADNFKIICTASRLNRKNPRKPIVATYGVSDDMNSILSWVRRTIGNALAD